MEQTMKFTTTTEIPLTPEMTSGTLGALLKSVPQHARLSVRSQPTGMMEKGPTLFTLVCIWDTEVVVHDDSKVQ